VSVLFVIFFAKNAINDAVCRNLIALAKKFTCFISLFCFYCSSIAKSSSTIQIYQKTEQIVKAEISPHQSTNEKNAGNSSETPTPIVIKFFLNEIVETMKLANAQIAVQLFMLNMKYFLMKNQKQMQMLHSSKYHRLQIIIDQNHLIKVVSQISTIIILTSQQASTTIISSQHLFNRLLFVEVR
jgi:hypothetical protein